MLPLIWFGVLVRGIRSKGISKSFFGGHLLLFAVIVGTGTDDHDVDRFYYADERQADGGVSIPPDGSAAAEAYVELAEDGEQRAWEYTFVKGKGYVEFKETKAPW